MERYLYRAGRDFIEVFKAKAKEIEAAAKGSPKEGDIEWLFQGTIYPDVIESVSYKVCKFFELYEIEC